MKLRVKKREKAKVRPLTPLTGIHHPDFDRRLGRQSVVKHPITRGSERSLKEHGQQKIATQLKLRGATQAQIAEHLGVKPDAVGRLIARALDEYRIDRDEAVKEMISVEFARYDQAMRVLWPDACGVRGDDGEWRVKPDMHAMKLALAAMRDLNKLLSHCRPQRVELAGAGGGPIRIFDCSKLTDEELALVIAAEKPEDVAGILQGQGGGGDGPPQEGGGPVH